MNVAPRSACRLLIFALAALMINPAHVLAKTLRWAGAGELVSCDPAIGTDTAALVFMTHIYERLVTRDREFALQPSLALSWESPSPTTMRFNLRPGVKFHDGTPFTAGDVAFSIARARTDFAHQIQHCWHQIGDAR